jgi:DNA processing protein
MDDTFDLLVASLLPSVGPRQVRALAAGPGLAAALRNPAACREVLPDAAVRALAGGQAVARAESERRRALERGLSVIGWHDADYPALLHHTYDPPPVLYARGRLGGAAPAAAVAVVGSRAASPQGLALARGLGRDLAAAGVTVVSGLARGIDTAAHQGALDAQGLTVAVLGSGHDRLYPRENASLAERIAETGAVVTEFPLGTPPLPGHFPRRNRIIAGWARAVVVVEARERSGALVTARLALDEGREVMAVPGHPSHPGAAGTNALLRDGARLVRDARDVSEELGLSPATEEPPGDAILAALGRDVPLSLDELVERVGWSAAELLGRLTALELDQRVRRLPGALFARA